MKPAHGTVARAACLRAFLYLCLGSLLACAQAASSDWDIISVAGRQYVAVRSLQNFYHLVPREAADSQQIRLTGTTDVLDLRAGARECAINGVRIWLSFPTVQHGDGWYVSRMDVAKTIEPALRPGLITGLGPVATVILDPGHGGHDCGAASWYGYEKVFALDIAKRVRAKLMDLGFKVLLTRDSDVFIPLEMRAEVANRVPNSIFVSIHFNAAGTEPGGAAASGIEVFSIAPRGAPSTNDNYLGLASFRDAPGHIYDMASFALGRSIHTALLGNLQELDRGLKRARFAVLRTARVPAVLVECGFLTNPNESRLIANNAHRDEIAEGIAQGIAGYKSLAETRKPPKKLDDFNKPIDTQITLRDDHETSAPSEMQDGTIPGTNPPPALLTPPPSAEAPPSALRPPASRDSRLLALPWRQQNRPPAP